MDGNAHCRSPGPAEDGEVSARRAAGGTFWLGLDTTRTSRAEKPGLLLMKIEDRRDTPMDDGLLIDHPLCCCCDTPFSALAALRRPDTAVHLKFFLLVVCRADQFVIDE
jgi:hypothetical protein